MAYFPTLTYDTHDSVTVYLAREKRTHLEFVEFEVVILKAHCHLKVANLGWAVNPRYNHASVTSCCILSYSELLVRHSKPS